MIKIEISVFQISNYSQIEVSLFKKIIQISLILIQISLFQIVSDKSFLYLFRNRYIYISNRNISNLKRDISINFEKERYIY